MMHSDEDLPPDVTHAADGKALLAVAHRLRNERPVMRPAARGAIRRRLESSPARRPRRLWVLVTGFAAAGALLLGIAATGLSDSGPLAPPAPGPSVHASR